MKKISVILLALFFLQKAKSQSVLIPGGIDNIGPAESNEMVITGSNVEPNGGQFKVVFAPPQQAPSKKFIRDFENEEYRFINLFLGNQSFHTDDLYVVKGDVSIPQLFGHDAYGGWNSIFSISDGSRGWHSNYTALDFFMKRVNDGGTWKCRFHLRFVYKRNGDMVVHKAISTVSTFALSSVYDWELQINPEEDIASWVIKINGESELWQIDQNEINDSIEDKLIVENFISLGSNNHTQDKFNINNDAANGNHTVMRFEFYINDSTIVDEVDIWESPLATVVTNLEQGTPEDNPADPLQALDGCEVSALRNINHIPNSVGWTALYAKQGAAQKAGVFDGEVAINGGLVTKSIKVTLSEEHWPDYVFEDNYNLMPLNELEMHLIRNKHLPGIPNETEVDEQGIDLGEMNAKLLKKIEELTLYLIQQNKKLQELEEKINYITLDCK